jgi:predicted nucleotidyltransferase
MHEGNLLATLRRLDEGKVEFIVVGGVAAVLNGAPIQTFDVDLVYSREAGNIDRILAVLASLDAVFRIQPERRLRPTKSHLAAGGHLNLMTRFGPLDLLGTIGQNAGFVELLGQSDEMDVGQGIRIMVLNLETIISTKEHVASEKDLAVLPILRRTLNEVRQKKRGRSPV